MQVPPGQVAGDRAMIEVSAVFPAKVQHRTGTRPGVTAIAITTCGRSVRKSLECSGARLGRAGNAVVDGVGQLGELVGDVE